MTTRTVLDKEIRRKQLVEAAVKVFARMGYRNAGINDIIFEAGVARGTFYLYFESKLEVFQAALELYMEGLRELVAREGRRDYSPLRLQASIRESLLDSLRYYASHRELASVVFREALAVDPEYDEKCMAIVGAMHQHWSEAILRLQKLGFVRADLDPEFLNHCFTGMFIQLVLRKVLPDPACDLERLADQWIEFTQKGVVAPALRALA